MSSAIAIKTQIRDLIARMTPPIVPTSTLAVQANPGDLSVVIAPCLTADGDSRFVPGGRLTFYDGMGERSLPIASVATVAQGTQLTLDFSNRPTGLQHLHSVGALCYANLLAFGPFDVSKGLLLGDPNISVVVLGKSARRVEWHGDIPPVAVHIQYDRLFSRPSDDIDENTWAEDQENATWSDLERIESMLLNTQSLATDYAAPAAIQFGPIGSNEMTDLLTTTLEWKPAKGNAWLLCGVIKIPVAAAGDSLDA